MNDAGLVSILTSLQPCNRIRIDSLNSALWYDKISCCLAVAYGIHKLDIVFHKMPLFESTLHLRAVSVSNHRQVLRVYFHQREGTRQQNYFSMGMTHFNALISREGKLNDEWIFNLHQFEYAFRYSRPIVWAIEIWKQICKNNTSITPKYKKDQKPPVSQPPQTRPAVQQDRKSP